MSLNTVYPHWPTSAASYAQGLSSWTYEPRPPHDPPAASLFLLASARSLWYVSPHSGITPYKPTSGERRALRVLPTSPLSTASLMAEIPKATASEESYQRSSLGAVCVHMTSPSRPTGHLPCPAPVVLTLHPHVSQTTGSWILTPLCLLGVFVGLPDSTLNFIQP